MHVIKRGNNKKRNMKLLACLLAVSLVMNHGMVTAAAGKTNTEMGASSTEASVSDFTEDFEGASEEAASEEDYPYSQASGSKIIAKEKAQDIMACIDDAYFIPTSNAVKGVSQHSRRSEQRDGACSIVFPNDTEAPSLQAVRKTIDSLRPE